MSMLPEKPVDISPAKKSSSPLGMILIGCFVIGLLVALSCAGVGFFAFRWGMAKVNEVADEFVAKGYERQTGQVIEVAKSPDKETVYVCQVLQIRKDVDVDIAVVSQVCEVHADIHGDVDFFGQILKVDGGVVIDGDLRIKNAQVIEVHGEVKGKISGSYAVLIYKGQQYRSGQSPDSPKADDEPTKGSDETTPPVAEPAPITEPTDSSTSDPPKI